MIPNLLTTVRLLLVPLFVYFIFGNENYALAAATFLVSGFTDIVDGFVARKFNMITDFGKVYDPFVDKLMQITVIVCLAIAKILPVWIIVIIIVKEVSMIVIGGILYFKDIVVHSVWYGKACTVLFYAIIMIFILWKDMPFVWQNGLSLTMLGTMILTGLAYGVATIKRLKNTSE